MVEPIFSGNKQISFVWTGLATLAGYLIYKCLYNLYLHPLSGFPGPKLAAIGGIYEFWFDVVRDGTYLWEIEKMHEKYGTWPNQDAITSSPIRELTYFYKGPIVRVNATELHIRDSQFYSSIYTSSSRRVNKDVGTYRALGLPTSVVATLDHDHHRARRGYLNSYFSKRSIVGIEPLIHERIERLCQRLEDSWKKGEAMAVDCAFSALTADIITQRVYGEHFDYLGSPGFKTAITESLLGMSLIFHLTRFVPGVVSTFRKMPIFVIRRILPPFADLLVKQEEIKRNILSVLDEQSSKESKSIIVSALGDSNIPSQERTINRLLDEGTALIFGGTETTSRALSVGLFYLLNNNACLRNLRQELYTLPFKPDNDYSLSQLEPLPYLTGVVNECLRLSFGPMTRLPRVAVHESLQYKDFTIPPGVPVSQSTYFVHTDPVIYPNPHSFEPERWTRAAQEGVALNRFLVSFSKGSRQCIGIQMAIAEIYLTIARLVRTFDMELYETTIDDVEVHHVRIIGYPSKLNTTSAKRRGGIMVKVTGKAGFGNTARDI